MNKILLLAVLAFIAGLAMMCIGPFFEIGAEMADMPWSIFLGMVLLFGGMAAGIIVVAWEKMTGKDVENID